MTEAGRQAGSGGKTRRSTSEGNLWWLLRKGVGELRML